MMMHVIYKGRALPLLWRVRQCPKGHFPEDLHIALVELVSTLIPEGTQVVFLGDGEFDGITLQKTHVQRQHGDVGRRDVFRRRVGGVSQAGAADRTQGGGNNPRGIWSGDAAVLLGEGSCRAVVFSQ